MEIYGGLQPKTPDSRDFSLGSLFGTPEAPVDISFIIDDLFGVKDQKDTDFCAAYAATSCSEKQEGVELSPEYQFNVIKKIDGRPDGWGAQLRDTMSSFVKYGSVPQEKSDELLIGTGKGRYDRDFIVKSDQWRKLDPYAMIFRKKSYFDVDGPYDAFDNIRSQMWTHRKDKCTAIVGTTWRNSWTKQSDGIIPMQYEEKGFGHAIEIVGQKVIKDKMYLVAKLSNGEEIGDGGYFYFPREVVNKEFPVYGMYMFKDLSREEVEYLKRNGMTTKMSTLERIFRVIINLIRRII